MPTWRPASEGHNMGVEILILGNTGLQMWRRKHLGSWLSEEQALPLPFYGVWCQQASPAQQFTCEASTFVLSKQRVQKRDICIFTLLHGPSRFSVRAPPPPPDNKWLANATDESRNESQRRTNLNWLRGPQKDNSLLPHFHPFAKCIVALIHTPAILSFLFHDSHQTNRIGWKGDS